MVGKSIVRCDTDKTTSTSSSHSPGESKCDYKKKGKVNRSRYSYTVDGELTLVAPSTLEQQENERFARKVGINFSFQHGDYLTLVSGIPDSKEDSVPSKPAFLMSPIYGKKTNHCSAYGDVQSIFENTQATPKREHVEVTHNLDHNLISPRTRTAMNNHDQILANLKVRASVLSSDWGSRDFLAPTLARRLRDFEFAQKKRRKLYGKSKQYGILSVYDFLSEVKTDVEWAELAAFNRSNCLPYVRWNDFVIERKREMNRPIFVYFMAVICTVAFVASIGANGWAFESMSVNPSLGPSPKILTMMGAKDSNLIVNHYQFWRFFTPMILHGGLVHFIFNFFAFAYIGRAFEHNHGFNKTLVLFVFPSVGSTIISSLLLPQYISVGASGGIFGLIGACVADILRNRKLLFSDFVKGTKKKHHIHILIILAVDIILNLLLGLTPFTDNFMHVGGFLLGFLWASTTLRHVDVFATEDEVLYRRNSVRGRLLQLIGPMMSIAIVFVALIYLYNGDGHSSPCDVCGVISCVSFPPWVSEEKRWWHCDSCGLVSAYGTVDSVTNLYTSLQIHCPDGAVKYYDLSVYDMDQDRVEESLIGMCREICL